MNYLKHYINQIKILKCSFKTEAIDDFNCLIIQYDIILITDGVN